uniref:Polymerase PA n=1 Tax=Hymenopteran orthomyxo-related virus OKIAV174 TaxID=2792558 RepID=A0A7T0M3F4_9ORTO|nr:polymerase PA [Hymenopteran orthomyxo-related virus OKIAV174]
MDDKHYDLIFNSNLYPEEVIREFGITGKHWEKESNRSRELSLRHDLACIYLCNLEETPYEEMLENLQQQRKRKWEGGIDETDDASFSKRQRTVSPIPSTSIFSPITKSLAGTSSSSGTITMDEVTQEAPYRFILVEGMPTPELIQNVHAKQWNMRPPNSLWDIIDVHLKKFIEVKVSNNISNSLLKYHEKRMGMGDSTALCIINPQTGECSWFNHPGHLKGERKVMSFIVTRYEIMRNLNIIDTEVQDMKDLLGYVMPDTMFNDMKKQWVQDWYPIEINETINPIILEGNKMPRGVTPRDLLQNLSALNEMNRNNIVKWKGKILPEGWTYNLVESAETDAEMISIVLSFIKGNHWEYKKLHPKSIEKPKLLETISEIWELSDNKNFALNVKDNIHNEVIKDLLGIGAKRRIHNQSDEATIQPPSRPIELNRYHTYFDEIIRRMNKTHNLEGNPMRQLLKDLPQSDHPIADIGIQAMRVLVENISERNSALFSSRLTNLYSRLGGAYLITKDNNKTTHSDIAMMPIYATLRNKITGIISRAITGIVLRGPQHSRSPTDKIQIITLEILENNHDNRSLLGIQKKHDIWFNNLFLIAVRPNSIMKEDSSFITFNGNALFVPSNLLGVMTMENQNVAPNIDMKAFVTNFLEVNLNWFAERYNEGVLMAAIGNSRDEGYFAQLRKLFMLILTYRRGGAGANWDIKEYCTKVNECLLDNPFSMHFHRTILKILQQYDNDKRINE